LKPNALLVQKHYREGDVNVLSRCMKNAPFLLTQCMGSGLSVTVGQEVEALKPGKVVSNGWVPSKWEKAKVMAVNYDGTYDVKFYQTWGTVRERKTELRVNGYLSLKKSKNERYKDQWGADHMPAAFRMMQEMNYMQATPPSRIRLIGSMDRLSDQVNDDASQDWFLCTSKVFTTHKAGHFDAKGKEDSSRLHNWQQQFSFSYKWVPTPEGGLRFEPVPNQAMMLTLDASNRETAEQLGNTSLAGKRAWDKLEGVKATLNQIVEEASAVKDLEPLNLRPSGPRVPAPAEKSKPRRSLAQELAADANSS
jgi:hypothetical protein